jgi:flagellar biosynthetic protein FliR
MPFDMLAAWALSVLLITVRLAIALGLSPVFASYGIPAMARLALIVCLSALMAGTRDDPAVSATLLDAPGALLAAVGAEAVMGILLGLGVHVALAAFGIAGRLLDVQIGFGIGSVFDPITRASSNVLASLLSLLGLTLFVLSGAHMALVAMLAESLTVFPVGEFPRLENPLRIATAAGSMFGFGLALAAPVVVALLITDVVVGILSRNSPQMNALMLAIPVKVVVGLSVLILSVLTWEPVVQRLLVLATDVLGAPR